MATIKLQGNASGSGSVTLTAPNTNSARTVTLPDQDVDLGALGGAGTIRAWVNWKNSGGNALVDSGAVSSVVDNATGVFTVTFSNAWSSATYTMAGTTNQNGAANNAALGFNTQNGGNTYSTTAVGLSFENVDAGYTDYINNVVMFVGS